MAKQQPTIREMFYLLKAGAYNLPPRDETGFITDSGRHTRPTKRFEHEQQFLRGSGAFSRPGYDHTDMRYNGPALPKR